MTMRWSNVVDGAGCWTRSHFRSSLTVVLWPPRVLGPTPKETPLQDKIVRQITNETLGGIGLVVTPVPKFPKIFSTPGFANGGEQAPPGRARLFMRW